VGAERKNEARVCARAVERGFVQPETSRSRWIEMDGSRSPDRVSAQAQVVVWSAGHAERERAGGPVSVSGRMAAWHGEHGLRASGPWAVGRFRLWAASRLARGVSSARAGRGPFSIFGPNFVVNSNLSQFIFCSEIV
jgi:hypothetical protein